MTFINNNPHDISTHEDQYLAHMHAESKEKRLAKIAALNPTREEMRLVAKGQEAIERHLEKYHNNLLKALIRNRKAAEGRWPDYEPAP